MSRCNRAKILLLCAKSWDLYAQTKTFCIFTSFTVFFFMIHTYNMICGIFFALFLAQNVLTKVLTAQKQKQKKKHFYNVCLWTLGSKWTWYKNPAGPCPRQSTSFGWTGCIIKHALGTQLKKKRTILKVLIQFRKITWRIS